jgi:hypothetical protein
MDANTRYLITKRGRFGSCQLCEIISEAAQSYAIVMDGSPYQYRVKKDDVLVIDVTHEVWEKIQTIEAELSGAVAHAHEMYQDSIAAARFHYGGKIDRLIAANARADEAH